ncbi:MAG TPA: MoaD/ThiS family protein [Thermoflexales bacterium]|jgi:molybdopterin synthase sulfur carrier subunit|nr:MoaD/ThiS family protein [Thermoflexales bacterium]HQX11028.1 MoaD/ThiS family protein [Thermoflexales bacterium]HQY24776.1 MoaD/ThiS family protein [Thermoflexales bacterium]HQZ53772.1 MoaD/ThiS family protein [Thermoflexales bacterium]HRA54261.1 MoaD/ThiS family protein [Thermoflexales bacterium]
MKIQLFATLRDRAKARSIEVALEGPTTVAELRKIIAAQHAALADLLPQALVAVNQEFAFDEDAVGPDNEVALFPPVSGG